MTALPDGQAAAFNPDSLTVMRVAPGLSIASLYTASDLIGGLQVQGSDLFVLYKNGTVVQVQLKDGLILKVHNTGISSLRNYASHHTDLCDFNNVILLVSFRAGQVYSYNFTSQTKQVNVAGINAPTSVAPACINGSAVYVVSERYAQKILVYNATWSLIESFGGGRGSDDGQFDYPVSAVISYEGYIYVSDTFNSRVSMFTLDGQFVKHIIIYDVPYYERKENSACLSVRGKYLWVTTSDGRLTRYIL